MVFKVLEIAFACVVLLMITRNKEKMLNRLGKAFVWFIGVNVAFTLYYAAYTCSIVTAYSGWNPIDYLSIAALCCLIVMGFEIVKRN
ncbi:hypothetical protein [Mediterraneibacter agrestimuris]|uniref:hypothetical protein n=1 Tax=Mediterraneibacter agrestimuris TaxID=2941333 RepID=UPI00203B6251|nr:hypothetical protein [Mediterraneibacter agrestimuris]